MIHFNLRLPSVSLACLIFLLPFLALSCGSDAEEEAPAETEPEVEEPPLQIESGGATFYGVLPCADCEGVQTTLTIDSTRMAYVKEEVFLGESDSIFTTVGSYYLEGGFKQDPDLMIYVLEPEDPGKNREYYRRLPEANELIRLTSDMEMPESTEQNTLVRESDMVE